jgi:hypothetical protein
MVSSCFRRFFSTTLSLARSQKEPSHKCFFFGFFCPYSGGLKGDGLEAFVEAVCENDGLEDLLCGFDLFFWWHGGVDRLKEVKGKRVNCLERKWGKKNARLNDSRTGQASEKEKKIRTKK